MFFRTLDIFREYNEARLGVFVTIGHHPEKNVRVNMIDANYVALDQANIEYSLSRSKPAKDFEIPAEHIGFLGTDGQEAQDTEFWISTGGWHDETAMIFLTFHVIARYRKGFSSFLFPLFKTVSWATLNYF